MSLLLVQVLYTVDLAGRLLLGFHPIGGSEYMFDPTIPLGIRLLSLFHVVTPPLLAWALAQLGYDGRDGRCVPLPAVAGRRPRTTGNSRAWRA